MTDFKRNKAAPSILSHDMHIVGQIVCEGDVQIEGKLDGNILSHALTIGEKAQITGEVAAEVITVMGRVEGTIRARQVHLCATSSVSGDIFHEALAIESGAHLDCQLKHESDPLGGATMKSVKSETEKTAKTTH